MIGAVTFDLWNTLLLETREAGAKVREDRIRNVFLTLQGLGHDGTLEELRSADDEVGRRLEAEWRSNRDLGVEEQVRILLGSLEIEDGFGQMAMADLEWAYVSAILKTPPTLTRGAKELLATLKARGYHLGVISNTGRVPGAMLRLILQRHEVLEYFDVLTFSDTLGLRKPVADLFTHTLERLGTEPRAALHIGDDPAADVQGARSIGMGAVLFGSGQGQVPDDVPVIARLEDLLPLLDERETARASHRRAGGAGVSPEGSDEE
ncbi:MAG: HAD family hydrolase [Candidatus Methylomirabilales bacterium]